MMIQGAFPRLGLAAVSLSGLLMLAGSLAAQERREGGGKRESGAREQGAAREQGRSEGGAREQGRSEGGAVREGRSEGGAVREGRSEGGAVREGRSEGGRFYEGSGRYWGDGGYWGYNRGYWGGYSPYWGYGYRPFFNGSRFYGSGRTYGDGYYSSAPDGYYDDGYYSSPGSRFFGRRGWRRGGDYSYGSYCGGGCYGSAGCTGGYYGSGCTGGSYYGEARANSGTAYGAMNVPSDRALIKVKVPQNAEISFGDFKTTQTGSDRQFITPPLEANRDFSYQLHARWMEGDKPIERSKKITVHAGGEQMIDLTSDSDRADQGHRENIAAPKRNEENSQAAPKRAQDNPQAAPKRVEDNPPAAPKRNEENSQAAPKRAGDNPQAAKEDTSSAGGNIHEGKVVSFSNHELVMTDRDGQHRHTHTLANDAKVTIDGKPGKPEDLKPDMEVTVTTKEGDKKIAEKIEAKSSK